MTADDSAEIEYNRFMYSSWDSSSSAFAESTEHSSLQSGRIRVFREKIRHWMKRWYIHRARYKESMDCRENRMQSKQPTIPATNEDIPRYWLLQWALQELLEHRDNILYRTFLYQICLRVSCGLSFRIQSKFSLIIFSESFDSFSRLSLTFLYLFFTAEDLFSCLHMTMAT
jgi:hypothetical protein